MLLHMRQVLSADQRLTLNAMHNRWAQEQRQRDRDRQRSAPGGNTSSDAGRKRAN
jgi:hypothetical protein